MKFLYSVNTTYEVIADNQDDADAIMWGAGNPDHHMKVIENDVMCVSSEKGGPFDITCGCGECAEIKKEHERV